MTNIKALDKLREKIQLDVNNPWSDLKGDLLAMCDKVEREVSERFMELPVDADGVPIHVGDMLLKSTGALKESYGEVVGVSEDSVWFAYENNEYQSNWANLTRHKPRTIEDVLRDCCNEWNEHCGDDWESSVYAKYADELRSMGVGE